MDAVCKPRSVENLRVVVALRDVEHSQEFKPDPTKGYTWCNKYVHRLLEDLEVPIPSRYEYAHEMIDYLASEEGEAAGWSLCESGEAVALANQGYPVVVGFRNMKVPPEGHSHIALMMPSSSTLKPRITQAGAHNYLDAPLELGFGHLPVSFWWHL